MMEKGFWQVTPGLVGTFCWDCSPSVSQMNMKQRSNKSEAVQLVVMHSLNLIMWEAERQISEVKVRLIYTDQVIL